MTMPVPQGEAPCPLCGTRIALTGVLSYSTGGVRTDFRPLYLGQDPAYLLLHLCGECGFAGYPDDFQRPLASEARETLRRALADHTETVSRARRDLGARFELAAIAAQAAAGSTRDVADRWLRASWYSESAEHRRRAVELLLAARVSLAGNDRAEATYLVGELSRRLGEETRAREFLVRVASEVHDDERGRAIARLAERQLIRPTDGWASDDPGR